MISLLWYAPAALGEIAGCFAFWSWLRLGNWSSPQWQITGAKLMSLTWIHFRVANVAIISVSQV